MLQRSDKMMNKRGLQLSLNMIIIAILALVFLGIAITLVYKWMPDIPDYPGKCDLYPPKADQPVCVPAMVTLARGDEVNLKVAFFNNEDDQTYLELMAEWCQKFQLEIWAYCLMPNHVHLITVPERKDSLKLSIGEAHRRYTRRINFREGWRGHLWQGRFSSFIMQEQYLLACTRYVELNPVSAGLVKEPDC